MKKRQPQRATDEHYMGWKFQPKKDGTWKVTPPTYASGNQINWVTAMMNGHFEDVGAGFSEALKQRIDVYTYFERLKVELLEKKEFEKYLCLFDRRNILRAFLGILPRLTDQDYWKLLKIVWESDDFLKRYRVDGGKVILKHWNKLKTLVSSPRPYREFFMSAEGRAEFAKMPKVLTIHRGFKFEEFSDGFSWITDIKVAKRFAESYQGQFVVTGKCFKKDVIGYLIGREESEVVIDPKHVFDKKVTTITA